MKQKPTQMYNLVYIVNGKVKETIVSNSPKGICMYQKMLKEKQANYRLGLLQCRKVK